MATRRSSAPAFRWDGAAGQYRSAATGRFVSRKAQRAEIDAFLANADRDARALAERLRSRKISLRRWEVEMRQLVKRSHLANAAIAKGGRMQLSPADYGRVGQIVRAEYGYLAKFAKEIRRGLPLDGRFLRRVELYTEAGRITYHQVERAEMRTRGFDLEENILAVADHCDGCLDATARGRVAIGSLPPVGRRTCRSRCRCRIRYFRSDTGQVAA